MKPYILIQTIVVFILLGFVANSQDLVSIHDIQYTTDPSGASPYENQSVMVDGKILAKVTDGNSIGYFIQDGTGSWNGLFVWDQTGVSGGFPLNVNTIWRFTGTVKEIDGLTVLSNLTEFNENGTVASPSYQVIEFADIDEEYESVLVRFEGFECSSSGNGSYIIKDPVTEETIKVVNYIYDPYLLQGNEYTITGLLYYINGEFVLCPRNAYDVDGIVNVQNANKMFFSVYPNPNKGNFNINFESKGNFEIGLYDVLGNKVYENSVENKSLVSLNLADVLSKGYYMLRIKDQNGDEITRKLLIQ